MIWISGLILWGRPASIRAGDLIGRLDVILLRHRLLAPREVTQIRHDLAPHPCHAVRGLEPDSPGKLALSLQPIDRGHRVRHDGQQLGPQNEWGLDMGDAGQGLWHVPTMPVPPHAVLWRFVGFCGDVPTEVVGLPLARPHGVATIQSGFELPQIAPIYARHAVASFNPRF